MALETRLVAFAQAVGADIKALQSAGGASTAYVDSAVQAAKDELRAGAGAALDTFAEVAQALADDDTAAAALAVQIGNRVRFDASQTLTGPQQAQACANIGIGNPEVDLVATYVAAKA